MPIKVFEPHLLCPPLLNKERGIYYRRGADAPLKHPTTQEKLFNKGIKRGFWSLLKRGINGVYHAVSEKYLQDYINAYAFRWNHRNDEKPMFLSILSRLIPSLQD